MRHLSKAELVDLAEGAVGSTDSNRHVAGCDRCRRELADLRAMLSEAAGVDVPEPSPLFWDHFSERVRAAVAAEGPSGQGSRTWWRPWLWGRVSTDPVAAVAVVVLAIVAVVRLTMPWPTAPPLSPSQQLASDQAARTAIEMDPEVELDVDKDPTLSLMSDLTTTWEIEEIREQMTRTRHIGGADEAFGALTDGERKELERLLTEQLTHPSTS